MGCLHSYFHPILEIKFYALVWSIWIHQLIRPRMIVGDGSTGKLPPSEMLFHIPCNEVFYFETFLLPAILGPRIFNLWRRPWNFWRKGISYTVQEVCCTLLKRYIVHCYFTKPIILRLPQYLWQQTTTSDSHLSVEVKVWRYKTDTGFTAVKSNVLQWPWYQRKVHYTLTSTRVSAENGINWQWPCRWRKLCGAPSFRTNQVTTGARFESVNWDVHNSLWHLCIM